MNTQATHTPNTDAFRYDNSAYGYRVKIDGVLLRNAKGEVRKFRTLNEACNAVNL